MHLEDQNNIIYKIVDDIIYNMVQINVLDLILHFILIFISNNFYFLFGGGEYSFKNSFSQRKVKNSSVVVETFYKNKIKFGGISR